MVPFVGGGKRRGRGVKTTSAAKVKNSWRNTSTPNKALWIIKHRGNFYLYVDGKALKSVFMRWNLLICELCQISWKSLTLVKLYRKYTSDHMTQLVKVCV
jgi:hypothetical protein